MRNKAEKRAQEIADEILGTDRCCPLGDKNTIAGTITKRLSEEGINRALKTVCGYLSNRDFQIYSRINRATDGRDITQIVSAVASKAVEYLLIIENTPGLEELAKEANVLNSAMNRLRRT